MTASRRQVLAAVGGGVTGVATLSSEANALARKDYQPDSVSITFDQTRLEELRPRLVFREDAKDKLQGFYGFLATSPDYDTDVAVYWASYSHQEGVSEYDSHYGDHEPVYVFANSETGEIQKVLFSAYHWLKGSKRTFENPHPRLEVVSPWHHYHPTTTYGDLPEIDDLTQVFDSWLANGLEDDLAPGSVVNPWSMQSRSDWWRRGTFGLSLTASFVRLRYRLGFDDAGEVETL